MQAMIETRHPQARAGFRHAGAFALAIAATAALGPTYSAAAEPRAPKVANFEFVVGSQPGSTPDIFMRRIAKILADEKIVTQPMVVQNRPGGGWVVASNYVLGKTGNEGILISVNPTIFTTPIVQGLPTIYDRLTPICVILRMDLFVMVRPDSPIKTMADYVALAKKKERSVQMAGSNVGSTDHIVTSLIEKAGGVKINYVPFDGGGGPIMSAFLGGSVDSIVLTPDEAEPLIKGGKARAIAVLSEQRRSEPQFKDIPTAKEVGVDVLWGSRYGVAAPPNLDPAVTAWWDDKLSRLAKSKAWNEALAENYMVTEYLGADKAKAQFEGIQQRFLTVLRDVGLSKK
jgi:putative tricarboxylic transport membrane protein